MTGLFASGKRGIIGRAVKVVLDKKEEPRRRTLELTGRNPAEADDEPLKKARRKKTGRRRGDKPAGRVGRDRLGP